TEEQATAPVALDVRVGPNIRLGDDPSQLPANMRAQAEPDIARSLSNDDFLVATFQEGRFTTSGGSVDLGYSTSHDGGLTWTRALIPNLTQAVGGPYFRATDPVVAFDLNNNVYISTDAATDSNFGNSVIAVTKSTDGGMTFGPPMVAFKPANNLVFPDKEWIAVNTFANTPTPPGRILVTFTLFSNTNQNIHPIVSTFSDDGGQTWSPLTNINGSTAALQGSQPMFLPNGNVVIVYWNFGSGTSPGERLESVISTDGGVTFGPPHLIMTVTEWNEPLIRSGSFLPSATVDRTSGNIYVVFQTQIFGNPRIAFTKSTDGGITWSQQISGDIGGTNLPTIVSDNPAGSGVFNPAINVSADGQTLSVVFYDHRNNPGSNTLVDLYMAQSFNGGGSWERNIRLTSISTDASLAPLTTDPDGNATGYMLGDYLGVAQSTQQKVPAVPVWIDTRTGNSDPFVTRVGMAATGTFTAWEAANFSLAQMNDPAKVAPEADPDQDGETNTSEFFSGTNPNDPASVEPTGGKELNISTRLHVETSERVGIAGFVISGTQPKKVIIRAIGPSLTQSGVPGALQDPTLQLFDANQNSLAINDNWRDSQQAEIEASGHAPLDNRESAMIETLAPGSYTAIISGVNNTTGAALLEVFDLDPASSAILTNISTRGAVETGDNVMIGGFVVGGSSGSQVLIRAIGPSLTAAGVPNALQDPVLELHDGNGNVIASNDNWKDLQQGQIEATGQAPVDFRESALIATLPQGSWTAIVSGKNGTSGVGLVEVFRIR
ncbi:MAG: hypothetical protein QOH31_1386, partial [Verrucomicrobiota bacterium]